MDEKIKLLYENRCKLLEDIKNYEKDLDEKYKRAMEQCANGYRLLNKANSLYIEHRKHTLEILIITAEANILLAQGEFDKGYCIMFGNNLRVGKARVNIDFLENIKSIYGDDAEIEPKSNGFIINGVEYKNENN